ncbi:MAG: hypothetical protein AAF840_15935, partial [Bacteroidota bacterium]
MKDLEKDFAERFQDREVPNGDFPADDLWADIAADLEEGPEASPGWFYRWGIWLSALILLVAIGAGISWSSWEAQGPSPLAEQTTPEATTTATTSESPTTTASTEVPTTNQDKSNTTIETTPATTPRPQSTDITQTGNTIKSKTTPSSSDQAPAVTTPIVPSSENSGELEAPQNKPTRAGSIPDKQSTIVTDITPRHEGTTNQAPQTERSIPTTPTTRSETSLSDQVKESVDLSGPIMDHEVQPPVAYDDNTQVAEVDILITSMVALLPIEPLPVNLPNIPELKVIVPAQPEATTQAPDFKRANPWKWEVGLFAGSNYAQVDLEISDDLNWQQLRNASEGAAAGAKYGIALGLRRKHWVFTTGLGYEEIWREFNYETLAEASDSLTGVLLRVVYNPITEETIARTFGDTVVAGQTIRRVRHFNNYRLWTVPFTVGYRKMTERWVYGLNAGILFQFAGGQAGRFAQCEGAGVDFTTTDTPNIQQPN